MRSLDLMYERYATAEHFMHPQFTISPLKSLLELIY